MKIAIIGSRGVSAVHYETLCQAIPIGASHILSGGARGADMLARRYANENGLPLTEFLPDYATFGRTATLRRNHDIVDGADYVIALWDGVSRGTAAVICYCLETYTPVRVYICHEPPEGET